MSYIISGLGNEVFYFWGGVLTVGIGLLLAFPYCRRMSERRYNLQIQTLRESITGTQMVSFCGPVYKKWIVHKDNPLLYADENYIGQYNVHSTASSPRVLRHIERMNRRARAEASRLSEASEQSVSSLTTTSGSRSVVTCPICLENVQLGVAPLCNHMQCGHCMFQYFELTETTRPYRCPLCRRDISMITAHFTRTEREAPTDSDLGQIRTIVIDNIMGYNRRYRRDNLTIWDQIIELPQLISHFLGQILSTDEGIPLSIRIRCGSIFVMALIYWLLPFDFFSEASHGLFGFTDDMGIIICTIVYFNYVYRRLVTHTDYFY